MMTMAMISPHRRPKRLQISSPGEEQRVAAAPRRRLEKRPLFWNFLAGGKKGEVRAPGGVGPTQEGVWRGQGLGRAMHPSGCPLAAPVALVEASGTLIFNIIFWDFSSVPKYPETCTKENCTGSSAENSVSPG